MRAVFGMMAAVAACGMLAACETPQQVVTQKEDLLAAAGFTVHPANSPQREAELHKLPADKFVTHTHGDHVVYVLADPLVCNCLYVGSQQDFDNYKQEVFSRQIADENQMTASMNQDNYDWGGWDWGPWGDGPWGGEGYWQ